MSKEFASKAEKRRFEAAHPAGAWGAAMGTTPKPRAGEHVSTPETDAAQEAAYKSHEGRGGWVTLGHDSRAFDIARKLEAERDLLRERERELIEALEQVSTTAHKKAGGGFWMISNDVINLVRALLAKHGR